MPLLRTTAFGPAEPRNLQDSSGIIRASLFKKHLVLAGQELQQESVVEVD